MEMVHPQQREKNNAKRPGRGRTRTPLYDDESVVAKLMKNSLEHSPRNSAVPFDSPDVKGVGVVALIGRTEQLGGL